VFPVQFVLPVGGEHKDRQVGKRAGEGGQQIEARGVCPVEVFKDEHERRVRAECEKPFPHLPHERSGIGDAPQDAGREECGGGRYGCGNGVVLEQIEPEAIRWRLRCFITASGEDTRVLDRRFLCKGRRERGLSHACVPRDQHETALIRRCGGESLAQYFLLPLAPDQAGNRVGRHRSVHITMPFVADVEHV